MRLSPRCGFLLGILLGMTTACSLTPGPGAVPGGRSPIPGKALLLPLLEGDRLGEGRLLVLSSRSRKLPEAWLRKGFLERLDRHLARGGGILLLGHAAQLCGKLGLASPSRVGSLQHGYGRKERGQSFRFGLDFEEADPLGRRPGVLWLGGGRHCRVEYCLFRLRDLGSGRAWAFFASEREGLRKTSELVALASWKKGRGRVCALGLAPLEGSLVSDLLAWFGAKEVVALPEIPPDPGVDGWQEPGAFSPLPPLAGGSPLRAPAHFGLSLPLGMLEEGRPERLLKLGLERGADLFLVRSGEGDGWLPGEDELLLLDGPGFQDLRDLAGWLHDRGALCALDLVDGDLLPPEKRSTWLERQNRELMDLSRHGNRALDGMGGRGLEEDGFALWTQALWNLHPAAFRLGSDPLPPYSAASVGQIRPEAGGIEGLRVAGLAGEELRRAFPPSLYSLLQVATQRERGAYPDWIRKQVLDFLGSRAGSASGVVLEAGEDPDPERLALFLDLCREPLEAAATFDLSATGRGGHRESLGRLLEDPPPHLRATTEGGCAATLLENRFFRLEGTGGSLLFDRHRRGGFGLGAQGRVRVSSRFMHLRIGGATPGRSSLLQVEERFEPRGDLRPEGPSLRLSSREDPWPRGLELGGLTCLELPLDLPPGAYRLVLKGRPRGPGALVEVSLEDRILGFLSGSKGGTAELDCRFDLVRRGPRILGLRLLEGASFSFLPSFLRRVGDLALEVVSRPGAGPRASMSEELSSSFYAERRRVQTLGGLPGFVLDLRYQRVPVGLRLDRFFSLPGYRLASSLRTGEKGSVLWILRHAEGPELWVHARGLGGEHRFRFFPGQGFEVRSYPRSFQGLRLTLLFGRETGMEPGDLPKVAEEILHPPVLEPRNGYARLSSPFAFPWNRCLVIPEGMGRFEIKEGGRWRWARGGWGSDLGPCLLVRFQPGSEVEFRFGSRRRVRGGPGASRLLSWTRASEDRLDLRLEALSPLCTRPSFDLERKPGWVEMDGGVWSYLDGNRVFLPRSPGDRSFRFHAGGRGIPSLLATTASLEAFSLGGGVLALRLGHPGALAADPPLLPGYVCEFRGPRPISVEGGSLVPGGRPGGFQVRARAGELRLRFAPVQARPR